MYELNFAYIHVAGNDNSLEKLLFPECDTDYFEIEYKNGRGHFKILRASLVCKMSLTDYKKIVSMLIQDKAGTKKAQSLHDLYVKMVNDINTSKEKFSNDKETLTELNTALYRLNRLNEILMDFFPIESLEVDKPIKMTKTTAYKMITRDQLYVDYNAKSFTKFGLTWIVSADTKIKGRKHIIVPCCGLACATFDGGFNQAIEIVDLELKTRVEKFLEKKTFPDFINLLKVNGIEKVPA